MMKKIILISIFTFGLLLQSCSPKLMPRFVNTRFFDYRKYADEGFFLSPDPYTGNFTPCGELNIVIIPADIKLTPANTISKNKPVGGDKFDSYYSENNNFAVVVKEKISSDELLEIAVSKAKEVGVNGIANFNCSVFNNNTSSIYYEIRGYAIKRVL